nr:MAG: ORF1 [TTV-like mini virus]
MPPFRTYYRNRFRPWRRRRPFRKWRFRNNLRRRSYRRRRTVRRKKRRYRHIKKKLKSLPLRQWQPYSIRKCRIQGMFPLFNAGKGRYSNNFEPARESLTNPTFPGGGGWSAFQLSLSTLYTEHERLLNWWTHTNKHLNLVRYQGVTLRFYRQPTTDYVASYQTNYPFELTRYHYMSTHPERQLMFNHKIIVPSFKTAPLNKKTYIKKTVKPPKQFINKWYFQKQFSTFPLIMITCSACSLDSYYISPKAKNNTLHIWSLNTKIFQRSDFKQQKTSPMGYYPKASYYMYGTHNGHLQGNPKVGDLIYLGNTDTNQEGETSQNYKFGSLSEGKYLFPQWGNPFFFNFIDKTQKVWVTQAQPTTVYTGNNTTVTNITEMHEDIVTLCSYNPHRDKGYGNSVYWHPNFQPGDQWAEPSDPDLIIRGFPLWILMWGWEDWTRKLAKIHHIDTDYLLVIRSQYIEPQLPAYIFMSDSWVNGQGPYHIDREETPVFYMKNWQPSWQYQKEAIEEILMSGPGTCKEENQIQAHLHYTFKMKWGGAPAFTDPISDPTQQPDYAIPNNQLQGPEIENPENDPTKEIYTFDTRRDIITMQAAKRIKTDSKTDCSLFTDGVPTGSSTTSIPIQRSPQKKKRQASQTTKKDKKALLQQLQLYRQHRQQLQQRFQRLTKKLLNSKSDIPLSE